MPLGSRIHLGLKLWFNRHFMSFLLTSSNRPTNGHSILASMRNYSLRSANDFEIGIQNDGFTKVLAGYFLTR